MVLHPEWAEQSARPRWDVAFRDLPPRRSVPPADQASLIRRWAPIVRDALIILVCAWVFIVWTATT